ncbi:hypothetical protein NKI15_06795 [Mesorhizobium sp. M0862]|uniref:hypothetical protein n=1 Tax=unclassified Mesorhizobium TaxID=325217 RepID=UPI003335266F
MGGRKKLDGISLAAFAREMGVTPNAVRQRVQRGSLAGSIFPDGSVDSVAARVQWFANSNPNQQRRKPAAKTSKLREAAEGAEETSEYDLKVERMQVDLEAAKINLERLKETTVDREEARRAIRSLMRVFRAAMLNFANRYASDIAAVVEADPVQLAGTLEEHMRLALAELSKTRAPMEAGTFGDAEC